MISFQDIKRFKILFPTTYCTFLVIKSPTILDTLYIHIYFSGLVTPPDQNGDLPISPINMPPIESPASPPLLYGARDLLTTSPPLPGLPPFLPPPPGVPFMPPPPHGVPHFMPPPPTMFPGDHRPPPLGRMSSPPLNSRYSPDSRAFSPYDRNSPSPTYDEESEYSPSSRGFNSFARDDRRDFRRLPPSRNNVRNAKGNTVYKITFCV